MPRTIKVEDPATWARFKSLAARKQVTMGNMLKLMVDEYERKSQTFWTKVVNYSGLKS